MAGNRLNSVLVKPAGPDCNMNCSYCFYLPKSKIYSNTKTHRMSFEILERLITQVFQTSEQEICFAWQGGEPTLLGLEFFKTALELQQKYSNGKKVQNSLQTNGLLLDKEWADFFRENNFLIGISIDGSEEIHDKYRTLNNFDGTWKIITDKIQMLFECGVNINSISVLNDYSILFPEETYRFLTGTGFKYLQFIPIIETDQAFKNKPASFSVKPEEFGGYLIKLFDLWLKDFKDGKPTVSIRFFESVFFNYVGYQCPECTFQPDCGSYMVIEHNGDVYPCDFFVEPEWNLGNIMKSRIIDIFTSKKMEKFSKQKSKYGMECKRCKWIDFCYGGCIKDRFRNPESMGMNHFCKSYKMFFEYADPVFKRLAENWKKENI